MKGAALANVFCPREKNHDSRAWTKNTRHTGLS